MQVIHNADRIMAFGKAMLRESRSVLMPHNKEPVQVCLVKIAFLSEMLFSRKARVCSALRTRQKGMSRHVRQGR